MKKFIMLCALGIFLTDNGMNNQEPIESGSSTTLGQRNIVHKKNFNYEEVLKRLNKVAQRHAEQKEKEAQNNQDSGQSAQAEYHEGN
jgi:hypothetical protein